MKRVKAICSAMAALLMMGSALAQGMADRKVDFDLAAQSMPDALNAFAAQTKMRIVFQPQDAQGLVTERLKGHFTPQVALKLLLGSSSLRYEFVDDRTVEIHSSRAADAVSSGEKNEPSELNKTSWTGVPAAFRLAQSDSPAPGTSSSSSSTTDVPQDTKGVPLSKIEQVVVTGTHIKDAAPVGSPVLIFTQNDFDKAGATTPQEFLATLSQVFGGGPSADTFATVPGQGSDRVFGTGVNLRGLGAGSTLVLVDGRRQSLSANADYVDISMIPLSAVERVEIVPDGASAIYGSDAVAGVVNFVMRKNFRGATTRVGTSGTTQGGGSQIQAAQSLGGGWSSGNALVNLEYLNQHPVRSSQREFTSDLTGDTAIVAGEEAGSLFLSANQQLAGFQMAFNGTAAQRTASDPYLDGFSLTYGTSSGRSRQAQGGLSIERKWSTWSASLEGSVSETRLNSVTRNVGAGVDDHYRSKYRVRGVTLQGDGLVVDTAAGEIRAAVGGEYRKEQFDAGINSVGGEPTLSRIGEVSVKSAYAEFRIPLLPPARESMREPQLAVSLAGRTDHYSNFGRASEPKFGLTWIPSQSIRFRSSYGKSFKTPSVAQLNDINTLYAAFSFPTSSGVKRFLRLVGNGNSDLQPERAKTFTAGLDFTPQEIQGFSARLTYFDTRYRDRISNVAGNPVLLLADPAYVAVVMQRGAISDADFNSIVSQALSAQQYRIIGCIPPTPVGQPCLESPSRFSAIFDFRLRNLAETHDRGIDFNLEQRVSTQEGSLEFDLAGTWLADFQRKVTPGSPTAELVDTVYNPVAFRARFTTSLERGAWFGAVNLNYTGPYTNTAVLPNTGISSFFSVDLNGRYNIPSSYGGALGGISLQMSLLNIFDRDPPRVNNPSFGTGTIRYDAANFDPYGRKYVLSVSKTW